MTTKDEVTRWVVESLKNENIKDPQITISGYPNKGDNYGGEITFVTASGKTEGEDEVNLDVVVKTGIRTGELRKEFSMKNFYDREIYLYSVIFPAFRDFQLSRGSKNIFNAIPKCYKTVVEEDVEVLVLENLKSKGFQLHSRHVPMNFNHLKLVVTNYAKFHSISFVMRDQNPEKFAELTSPLKPIFNRLLKDKMKTLYQEMYDQNMKYIRQIDHHLSSKMDKLIKEDLADTLLEINEVKLDDAVVTHGDCWNSNFMFRYKGSNTETPEEVAILDWQLSFLHSPVCDLSYFLYTVCSKEELDKSDELLRYYHKKLSFFISEMGSDPEKLFPYSRLLNDWQKYSIYGIAPLIVFLKLMMCDRTASPAMDNKDNFISVLNNIKAINDDAFNARLLACIEHFCTWNRDA